MTARAIDAVTLDFFDTLVFHRDGRGRGAILSEYLAARGLEPEPWEHRMLYEIFDEHDADYDPAWPRDEREAYHVRLASRALSATGSSPADASRHAGVIWEILGPSCFGVFPEVEDTLRALRARGLRLAVISNWQRGLRHFCAELGLAGHFEHIVGSADLGVAKPEPGIFREACERLGVAPERTLHVGDTFVDDVQGGGEAGLHVALIDRSGPGDPRAATVVRGLDELPGLLDGFDER